MRNSNFIFIPGMYGMVGSSLYRYLTKKNKYFLHSRHVDFLNKSLLHDILKTTKIEKVFLCAAKVGGIEANSKYPLTFLNKNIVLIQNLIHELYNNNCNNLIYFGSSCIFPKKAPQPMKEVYLFKGLLEPTNEAYSLAKLIGLKLCEYYKKQLGVDYNTVIPSSLFGRGDNYNLKFAHVIPSVLKKIYVHKISNLNSFYVWGTGSPLREFLDVDVFSNFLISLGGSFNNLNVGSGYEISIKNLVSMIKKLLNFKGDLLFDSTKPDGMFRKCILNSIKYRCFRNFYKSLQYTYRDFLVRKSFL